MMLVGLAFKLSLVPFHLWTPDVYEGAPAPVARSWPPPQGRRVRRDRASVPDLPAASSGVLSNVLTVIAMASILFGNLLALTQSNLKRLLGYSSIAHFGYLLIALVASKGLAVEAIGVYLVTYVITSLGAFGVITLMSSPYKGRDADALYEYRGLFWRRPYLTAGTDRDDAVAGRYPADRGLHRQVLHHRHRCRVAPVVAGRRPGAGQRHRRVLLPARDGHPVPDRAEPASPRRPLNWEQKPAA
jgi:hypothetical protein